MPQTFPAAAEAAATAVRKLSNDANDARLAAVRRIVEHCKAFQGADLKRSVAQTSVSLAIYFALVAAMIALAYAGEWGVALLLSPLAGGVLVKLFTIQHDCGHGSYFKNRRANSALGFLISLLTFTPYGFWRVSHNRHHAGSGRGSAPTSASWPTPPSRSTSWPSSRRSPRWSTGASPRASAA